MKLIVAGGRFFSPSYSDQAVLLDVFKRFAVTEIVSGGAKGADFFGEMTAKFSKIPVKQFLPDWNKHGSAAGPIRNKEMAAYADGVVLFRGGRGTESMAKEAELAGLKIFDCRKSGVIKEWQP